MGRGPPDQSYLGYLIICLDRLNTDAAMLTEKNDSPCSNDDTSAQNCAVKSNQSTDAASNKNLSIDDIILSSCCSMSCNDQSEDDNTADCSISSGESFETSCSQHGILRAESRISEPQEKPSHQRKRKVRFGTVLVRDYSIILGDHPCVSYGPPLTIDWDYHEYDPRGVDEFEFENAHSRRSRRKMMLNCYQRKNLLAGYTELELEAVKNEIKRAKSRRNTTKWLALAPFRTVEAALESTCRKCKRMLK